jgi:hypothetical protein
MWFGDMKLSEALNRLDEWQRRGSQPVCVASRMQRWLSRAEYGLADKSGGVLERCAIYFPHNVGDTGVAVV